MGIDINVFKILNFAYKNRVSFDKVATIGRQFLYIKSDQLLMELSHQISLKNKNAINQILNEEYSESLFKIIFHSTVVDSFDKSNYENATYIRDFNYPIDSKFKRQYCVVFDGGSLEHIFNFPTAISNCMEMIDLNGHYIGISPTNNFCGHGFYQFSPELWYRIFSNENGFIVKKMIIYKDYPNTKFYEIKDPAIFKTRISLINDSPTYLAIIAQRVKIIQPFSTYTPQQSDYVLLWNKFSEPSLHVNTSKNKIMIKQLHYFYKKFFQKNSVLRTLGDISEKYLTRINL